MDVIKYTTEFTYYSQSGRIESHCNSITFKNVGLTDIQINHVTIGINEELRIDGNIGEIDITTYNLDVAGSVTALCLVMRKLYSNK